MTESAWRDIIIKSVKDYDESKPEQVYLIVKILKDYEDAKQSLRERCLYDFVSITSSVKKFLGK